jgi:hypothetical protein
MFKPKKPYQKKKKVTINKTSKHGIKACHKAIQLRKNLTKKDIQDRKKRLKEFNSWFK